MMKQGIAVVVPVLNEAAVIGDVLDQLVRDLPPERDVRIYVADGGSRDATPAVVARAAERDSRIRLIDNSRRLQSAAVNLVAGDAEPWAGTLIRCDAHSTYPPGFVRRVHEALQRTEADSVVVPMDSGGTTCTGRAIAWVSDTPLGSGGSAHRGGRASGEVDHGHHAGWRLTSFLAAGGYDESYSHNEDAELDCRLRRLGGRIWLDANNRIGYHVRSSLGALARQYRSYGRGRSRTVRHHPGSMRLRQLAVPAFIVLATMALVAGLWFAPALLLPGAYLAVLAIASVLVAIRHRSWCGLLAGPAAMVMHVAWAEGFLEGLLLIREPVWDGGGAPVLAARRSGSSGDAL